MSNTNTTLRIAGSRSTVEGKIHALLFGMIQNPDNWKYPIHAVIPANMFEQFNRACIYHTAGGLTITNTLDEGMIEVKANGYYVDCGS